MKKKEENNTKVKENKIAEKMTDNKEKSKVNKDEVKFEKSKESPKRQEKDMKEMYIQKKKRKKQIIILSIIIIIIALFVSTIFALVNINNDKIMSGISIAGIDMSGLSKEEATAKLELIYNEKKEKDINLIYNDYETTLNPTLMEVNYGIEQVVNNAYEIGKKDNIFQNNYEILLTLISKKNIPVEMTLNEDVTRQTIEDIGVNLPGILIQSSYSIEENELIITKGKKGIVIDTDTLLNKVKEKLNNTNINDDYIEIPVIEKEPDEIDIQKIHDEIYEEAQDAYITEEPFAVYPEVEGIDFDLESAREMLK